MKDIHIYISGKIGNGQMPTPDQLDEATAKFYEAEKALRKMGYIPINPLTLGFTKAMNYQDVIDHCKKVIRDKAHAIFMLDDWRESAGSRQEMIEAGKKRIPLYFQSDMDRLQLEAGYYYRIKEMV